MLKKIALAVVLLVAGVLAYAATRPGSLHVEREILVNAPPEAIYPLIEDFHRWTSWSPYEGRDPEMQRTYSGAPRGEGAVYAWAGNSQVGAGRMAITDAAAPSRVAIALDFTAPLEGHDVAVFALAPQGGTTKVSWTMDGPTPYIGKLIGVFLDMDAMIGGDFETGLARLKALAER